jgi:hypothetical protein
MELSIQDLFDLEMACVSRIRRITELLPVVGPELKLAYEADIVRLSSLKERIVKSVPNFLSKTV